MKSSDKFHIYSPLTLYRVVTSAARTRFCRERFISPQRYFASLAIWLATIEFVISTGLSYWSQHQEQEKKIQANVEFSQRYALVFEAERWYRFHPKYGSGKDAIDCSGLVSEIYKTCAQHDIRIIKDGWNGVKQIYEWCEAHGCPASFRRPIPGDIVFFDEAHVTGRDGTPKDLSHIGIVESVLPDNSFVAIHATTTSDLKRGCIIRSRYEWGGGQNNGSEEVRGFAFVGW